MVDLEKVTLKHNLVKHVPLGIIKKEKKKKYFFRMTRLISFRFKKNLNNKTLNSFFFTA